jgi:hypothetical protein
MGGNQFKWYRAGVALSGSHRGQGQGGDIGASGTTERNRRGITGRATLWFVLLAVAATAPALFGSRSLGPEASLDADPLYTRGDPPRPIQTSDFSRVFYDVPREFATARGLHQGRIDLWNPRAGFGMPLWADGGGLFFPTKLPFYLAPSLRTYDAAAALRLVIAGLGAFLLARRRGLAAVPAAAAGSLFELSGAILSTLQFGELTPPCLLPWVLLGAEAIAQQRRQAAAAATGLALGAAANSGHPMFAVVVFMGFAAAVCGHMLAAWRRPRTALAIGGLATLAVVLSLAVAASALLPLLESLQVGRLYKITLVFGFDQQRHRAETRAALPVALFAPATLQGLRTKMSVGFPFALVSPALGLLGLVLAVVGLLRRGLDAALLAVGIVGVGLTLAPPVLGLVGSLPLVRYVYPMYAWSLVALPATQAAGRGVAVLSLRGRWTLLVALAIVAAGALSLIVVPDVMPGTLFAFPLRTVLLASVDEWNGWLCLVLPLVLAPLVVIALVVGMRTRFAPHCALAATVVAAIELLVCVAPTTWFPDSRVLGSAPSPQLQFLQQGLRGERYRMLGWPQTVGLPATPTLFGLTDVRGAAEVPAERYVRYLEAMAPKASWIVLQFPNVMRHPLLDLGAVRYVVRAVDDRSDPEPFLQGDAALRLAYRDRHVAIYENNAALPRARVVHSGIGVRDQDEARLRLRVTSSGRNHAADTALADHVFLEPSADGQAPPDSAAGPSPGSDTVDIVAGNDPDTVELQATLSAAGWVVLSDTFYPGWTASIDGASTPIHPADLLFRAVFVPAGTHRIVFRYEPFALRLGLGISVLGLITCGLLLVRDCWAPPARLAVSHRRAAEHR